MVNAYDPALRELPEEPGIKVRSSIVEACATVEAVVVATEWPEFADMDLRALRRVTRGDLLFDGRSLIPPATAAAAGFRYAGPAGFMDGTTNTKAVASPRLGTAA
jgi:UDPglucose 6-dehydrogenase